MEVNKGIWLNDYDMAYLDEHEKSGKLVYCIFFEKAGISRPIKSFDFDTEAEVRSFMFKVDKKLKTGILKDICEELTQIKNKR